MKKLNSMNMCEGPLFKNMFFYTVPIILASVLQLFFNAADLVVVGRYAGSISVAAVGATSAIINLTVSLFMGLSLGAGVVVAQSFGAKNDHQINDAVHNAILTAFISGIVLTIVGVSCSRTFLEWMKTPDAVIPLSTTYMQIYFYGIIPMMLYNFGSAILRAVGDTKSPLIFLSCSGVINVILNIIFVKYFHMDVAGVALATTISQTVSAALVIIALMRRTDSCKLNLKQLRFTAKTVSKILAIGLPSGLQGAMFSISNVLIQSSINSLGEIVMSGDAAAKNIEGFAYVSMNAYHQASMNFVGQNMGAGKYDRVKKILGVAAILACATAVTVGGLLILFSRQLLSLYIVDSAEAIEYGMIRMFIIIIPYFLCGLMEVLTGTMRGMGASLTPMIITIFGVCGIRILWINTLFKIWSTLQCLAISYPISWFMTASCLFIVYLITSKKIFKKDALMRGAI